MTTPDPEIYGQNIVIMGGGIAGSLTALELANKGFQVTLLESRSDIMLATSVSNAARENTGLHYPKDLETGKKVMERSAYFHLLLPDFRRTQDTDPATDKVTPIPGTQYFVTSDASQQHVNASQLEHATEELTKHYSQLVRKFPKLADIYGPPDTLFTKLEPHTTTFPAGTNYGIQSQDKFFDINQLAASITEAVENNPNIKVHTNHKVTSVTHDKTGKFSVICHDGDDQIVRFSGDQVINNTWTNASLLDSKLACSDKQIPDGTVKDQFLRLKGMLILEVPDGFVVDGPKFVISKNGGALIPLPTPGLVALIGGEDSIIEQVVGKGEPELWGSVLSKNLTPASIPDIQKKTGLKIEEFADHVFNKGKDMFHLPEGTKIKRVVMGAIATEDKDITTRKSDMYRPVSDVVPGYISVVTDKFYNGPAIAVATAQQVEKNAYVLAGKKVPAELEKDFDHLIQDTIAERERTNTYPVRPIQVSRVKDFCSRKKRLDSGSLSEALVHART